MAELLRINCGILCRLASWSQTQGRSDFEELLTALRELQVFWARTFDVVGTNTPDEENKPCGRSSGRKQRPGRFSPSARPRSR
jgi:hypothetical protein